MVGNPLNSSENYTSLHLVFGVCLSFVSQIAKTPVKYKAVTYCIGK